MDEKAKTKPLGLKNGKGPKLTHSYTLHFIGDWGQANFHRICGWITQEFCDRAGPESRVATWSIRHGGIEALSLVHSGEADLAIATPADLMKKALSGDAVFDEPMPKLRALAVLPQNDRLVLAIRPQFGVKTFEDLRKLKPAIKIATSFDDGTNFIGYVARKYMEAHGISETELNAWGSSYITYHRPEDCIRLIETGEADAVLQEAIMTPWWSDIIETNKVVPIPAEPAALSTVSETLGMAASSIPVGYWTNLESQLPALDFSDFVVFVRDDMPEEVSYTLTYCLVETRGKIERQFRHLKPDRSPLSYPLDPYKMAKTPFPLHVGASRYYHESGYVK